MISLSSFDYLVIAIFFAIVVTTGLVLARRARKNLESYYLGGRRLPWYLLGVSGMSAWFDLTGTMIITSFLFLLGPRGLYIEFRGGAVLVLAFLLAYTAKWHRRSGCMTGAEWNTYRFGTDFSAEMLRFVSALMGIVCTLGLLAYMVRGATLFMGMIFPVDPTLLSVIILGLAAGYTVLAGFYGVVLTDAVEGLIMITGCITVSLLAWNATSDAASLSALAEKVVGNPNWASSAPTWHAEMPEGYEAYRSLMMAALFYLARNILGGMATGGDARYLASRNPRDASRQCLIQGLTVMFRWPLMISFAILGLHLVARQLPDPSKGESVARLLHEAEPSLTASNWHHYTSNLAHHPETAAPELLQKIISTLGPNWQAPLMLIGQNGRVNPEVVLPAVMLHSIQPGLRGLLIVSLLAALMGALTGSVNGASALFVRDIYQNFLRPRASNRELMSMAYFSSVAIVVAGFAMGLSAPSINDLWSWLIMGLTAGTLGPGILRLYWWRANAWGMTAGVFFGGIAAVIQRLCAPHLSEWIQFSLMTSISFAATIVGSLLTSKTPVNIVRHFYHTTRPFGIWGDYWKELPTETKAKWRREHRLDILTVASALVWQVCLFLIPMQILTRNWLALYTTLPIFAAGCVALYFFWWRNLPPADEVVADFVSVAPADQARATIETKEESIKILGHS